MSQSVTGDEDALRAHLYDYLGALLSAPPGKDLIEKTRQLAGDKTDLGRAVSALARVAATVGAQDVEREYHGLFIGIGRGELLPYASFYMTGFLNEKPLAALRADMARLGIERTPNVFEPEDNIGSLCEMMAGLIDGRFGERASLVRQQEFFGRHVAPWATHFFTDLEGAQTSLFYAPVGAVGRIFMGIEKDAFRMAGISAA